MLILLRQTDFELESFLSTTHVISLTELFSSSIEYALKITVILPTLSYLIMRFLGRIDLNKSCWFLK